jgi:hypothetical protein
MILAKGLDPGIIRRSIKAKLVIVHMVLQLSSQKLAGITALSELQPGFRNSQLGGGFGQIRHPALSTNRVGVGESLVDVVHVNQSPSMRGESHENPHPRSATRICRSTTARTSGDIRLIGVVSLPP